MTENKEIVYTGIRYLTEEETGLFYSDNKKFAKTCNIKENQYIIINKDEIYCYQYKKFRKVLYQTIDSKWNGKIKPLEEYQIATIDLLKDKKSKVKVIRGVYGSGKDYLMLNTALELVEKGKFEKIVFIRPNVTLENVPQIGYLPNGVEEKLAWTMAPFYDKVGGEEGLQTLIEQNRIEMVPLLFIRGRSFEKSIIYVTEAQNMDKKIAKVIISRVGKDSELWMNGDVDQTDSKIFEKDNGIRKMLDKLAGHKLFSTVYLPITHRSDVAELANLLDD